MAMTRFLSAVSAASALASCGTPVDRVLPDPIQSAVVDGLPVRHGRIVPLASFSAEVLVLGRKDYDPRPEDLLASYAPMDIVAAWGAAGRQAVRSPVSIAQGRRRYGWSYAGDASLPVETRSFGRITANWHLVPSSDAVRDDMDDIGRGRVVRIVGRLVKIRLADGSWATSSLTRDDAGDGACEIILVDSVNSLK